MSNVVIWILLLSLSTAAISHGGFSHIAISSQGVATSSNEVSPPPLPSSFYGVVTLDGTLSPAAVVITAWVNDELVAQTTPFLYDGAVYYRMDVPGDNPATAAIEGGAPGAVVRFMLGQSPAASTALWIAGTNRRLDLTPERHTGNQDLAK